MRVSEIRQKFLEFFKSKDHTIVGSSPVVPQNDPTLLFTNAGMNQFKDVFLGKEKRDYKRAASSQKCVRAGGKHNDLENVGFTARHHTFFEMLGNFSFGDYFKADAIKYAWEFSTQVLKLPKDKLYVTVFETDDEAADIWHNQEKVPRDRIFRMGAKDNFWQMGDTGPCGPCSELFIDRGEKYCEKQGKNDPSCKVGCDCDRFMEYWNLVFMQYNRDEKGELHPLPKPSVDTGAGLERIGSIMQNAESNYDTDIFKDIIEKTAALCGKRYSPDDKKTAPSFRAIADHARAATFLIADGVIPSNEGRGYVLRRILRRAVRHGQLLGFTKPFLHKVCSFVIDQMLDAYPYLKDQASLIDRCVFAEEEQFLRTLANGLELLDVEAKAAGAAKKLSGAAAFKLYDTYGFPLDLTRLICRERGLEIDEAGFERAMEDQKNRSREHWKGSGDAGVGADYHAVVEDLKAKKQLPEFVGYDVVHIKSACVAILGQDGDSLEAVFAKTPFYGESGGQVGDRGSVVGAGFKAEVVDVKKPLPDLIVCKLKVLQGTLKLGESYEQIVDNELRGLTARNHTATHLLHWALRKVLGTHVKQAGSLVTPELLRFDFTHFQQVTAEELKEIEDLINAKIWSAQPVGKKLMSKDEAISAGAIAMFGEKYGDTVRVVNVGDFSVELCGGTHVENSSEISMFKISSEGGIAAGVRRVVAYTSKGAFNLMNERYNESKLVRDKLKASSTEDVEARLDRMINTEKELRRTIDGMKSQNLGGEIDELFKQARKVGAGEVVVKELVEASDGVKTLREIGERLKQKSPNAVVVLGLKQPQDGKVFVLAACGKDIQKKVDANEVIKQISASIEGRGGGKAEMAQAGGTNLAGLADALKQAAAFIDKQLQG